MKRFMIILAAVFAASFSLSAFAQNPVITLPNGVTSTNASSTIAVTNTFQSIWAADITVIGRTSCTVQNNGTNSMWIFFGPLANATKNASVVLAAGKAVYCNINGNVLKDQVSITGTSGDAFFAAIQ